MPAMPRSAPARPWWCSTSRWRQASTCAAAGRARARPRCSTRHRPWRASTPSCLSGGSAFGLDAASGVQAYLREIGRGFRVRDARRADRAGGDPVRPAQRRRQELGPLSALSRARLRGGENPPALTSRSAAPAPASAPPPSTSRAASARLRRRRPAASPSARWWRSTPPAATVIGDGPHFWAAPFERDGEFGGRGLAGSG